MGRKIMHCRTFAVAALMLTGSACASGRVSTDFDPGTDFTRYETFAWMEQMPRSTDARVSGDLMDRRFRRSVESELAASGLQKAPIGQADMLVGYQIMLKDKVDQQTVNRYWGPSWRYGRIYPGGMNSRTITVEYTVGTLVIDVFDAEARELIWRGTGEGRTSEARDPEGHQERINQAVAKIMADFPVGR